MRNLLCDKGDLMSNERKLIPLCGGPMHGKGKVDNHVARLAYPSLEIVDGVVQEWSYTLHRLVSQNHGPSGFVNDAPEPHRQILSAYIYDDCDPSQFSRYVQGFYAGVAAQMGRE